MFAATGIKATLGPATGVGTAPKTSTPKPAKLVPTEQTSTPLKISSFAPSPTDAITNLSPAMMGSLGALLGIIFGQSAPKLGLDITPSPLRDGAIGAALALSLQKVMDVHSIQDGAVQRPEVAEANPRSYL